MARTATVVDCRQQCRKMESECMDKGDSTAKCRDEARKCESACIFK